MKERIRISTTINPELWEYAGKVAKKLATSRNQLIEEALGRLLPDKEFQMHQEEFFDDLHLSEAEDF